MNKGLMTKLRPNKFSELFGCDLNKKVFLSHIKKVDGATYLLSGSRGTGKSTFANLMAKKICNKYESPIESVVEINISDKTGVETARSIIDDCKMGSFFNSTIYILNEFHEATKNFQDAVLDIFENHPKNTFFIICTTEPQKIKEAALSRCTRLKFSPLSKGDSDKFINWVKEKESVEFDEILNEKIYEASFGTPREILSIIESISKLNTEESIEFIENYKIDLSKDSNMKEFNQEIFKRSSMDKALDLMNKIQGKPEDIRQGVLNYLCTILIKPFRDKETARLKASLGIECFKENVFYSGKAGLALAIYNYYSEND